MKRVFSKLAKKLISTPKGQGLVETAIIAPIIIFMIIGVFEVGWALRGYIVLVNVNREITRFAVRPSYLDFSTKDPLTVGYDHVLTHTFTTLGDQLPLDFQTNSNLIVSHLVVDTAYPCNPEEDIADCDCDEFVNPDSNYNEEQDYFYDDLILHPETPGYEYYTYSFPFTGTTSSLNYAAEVETRRHDNNKFNCELLKKGGLPSANNMITTELTFQQPQLFGFPLISNPLTDPVALYTRTTMRLIKGARSSESSIEDSDTIGPVCDAYPFTFHKNELNDPQKSSGAEKIDILGGPNSSDWGFLSWNPVETDSEYLRAELRTGRTAINDYTNARDNNDHQLSVGDYVTSLQGVESTIESRDRMISALIGKTIRIPVYDYFEAGTGPHVPNVYHVSGFVWVEIRSTTDIGLTPGKVVWAYYVGDASDACTATGGPSATPPPGPTPTPGGPTLTPTQTPTNTPVPTNTPSPTSTNTPIPTNTPTLTPTPTPAVHVQHITVTVNKSWKYYWADVTVKVIDANGSAISNANVYGTFSGDASGNVNGNTNSQGQITFSTNWQWQASGPYGFCVTNITKNGYSYDPTANGETCDSGSY